MNKYISIFISFTKNNLIREMEFRGNFLILSFFEVLWVFFQLLIIQLMFQFTNEVFGWTKFEIFFLMGFFRFVKGIIDTFVRPNFLIFPTLVTKGDLDLVLSKPINAIFMVSTRRQDFVEFSSAIAGIGIMIYALSGIEKTLSFEQIGILIVGAIASFVAFYSLFFMMTTVAFFVPRMTALRPFYDLITNFARFPSQIFSQGKLFYEILLIPVFLVATFPIQLALGKSPIYFLTLELAGAVFLVFLAVKFWNFAIKHYSSASS